MGFLPQSPQFFDLFEKLSSFTSKTAMLLLPNKLQKHDWKKTAQNASALERTADDLCHNILQEADKTFITPIDREDIQALAKNLDNIIDLTENVISHMEMYKIAKIPPLFYEFCDVVVEATKQVDHLVSDLKHKGRNTEEIRKHIVAIHSLENNGDLLLGKALRQLFTNNSKPLEVIKWKDIYENLEQILDECEDTSDTVETIIIKNF